MIAPHIKVEAKMPTIKARELYIAFFVVNKYTCTDIDNGSRQSVRARAMDESSNLIIGCNKLYSDRFFSFLKCSPEIELKPRQLRIHFMSQLDDLGVE